MIHFFSENNIIHTFNTYKYIYEFLIVNKSGVYINRRWQHVTMAMVFIILNYKFIYFIGSIRGIR
jgi:hypothetical protein